MQKSKKNTKSKKTVIVSEGDSTYIYKMVAYMIAGSIWLRYYPNDQLTLPLPIGAIIALLIASHEKFQIDRKIEYVVLMLAMFIGFWLPIGIDIYN